ncbi:MAG TPA: hypothetical protein VI793_06140 [Anaerolineales bacterium]|nr:hypothetical protein [Anaerolineales bacterium]
MGDPRLREMAHHVLRNGVYAPVSVTPLVRALGGPAADVEAMIQADQLQQQLEAQNLR